MRERWSLEEKREFGRGNLKAVGGSKEQVAAHAVELSFVDVEQMVCFGKIG